MSSKINCSLRLTLLISIISSSRRAHRGRWHKKVSTLPKLQMINGRSCGTQVSSRSLTPRTPPPIRIRPRLMPTPSPPTFAFSNNRSHSITPNSRTLLVELHLDNPNNEIQPGSYAQARLTSGSLGQIVTLPNNTLLFRAQGLQVGVVKPDGTVELRDIKVGRDFGTTIQIVQGGTPSDKVILNPADSLVTGDVVHIAAPAARSPATVVAKK